MAPGQPGRPARLSRGRQRHAEYPRLVFERKRTLGEIVLEYGSTNPVEGSNVQPAAGVWTPGRSGPTASFPGRRSAIADSWKQADELALFYPHPAKTAWPNRSRAARADSVDPPQVLSPRPAGRRVFDALVAIARRPRWAVGQQVRAALKLAGTRERVALPRRSTRE